ncbi:10643_t:CDS:2 [Diversispora eburnea]|uniref:10643_t:CDS:1 n=1 Tax=Diversispora eburnea TaxID=1213867 RepID=A0A9N9GCH3_9GLOM|nr:10643_t:CDS:2 [Diversispora eburnea]
MSNNAIHKYFNQKYTKWCINEFLKECDEELFQVKIDIYLKSLQNVVEICKGKQREKAQQLLDRYKNPFSRATKPVLGHRQSFRFTARSQSSENVGAESFAKDTYPQAEIYEL